VIVRTTKVVVREVIFKIGHNLNLESRFRVAYAILVRTWLRERCRTSLLVELIHIFAKLPSELPPVFQRSFGEGTFVRNRIRAHHVHG